MNNNLEPITGSFRDPDSSVYKMHGAIYRKISESFMPHYRQLMDSGLYEALGKSALLVTHEEVGELPSKDGFFIKPEVIPFISYPYEWSFSQFKDAALLTLEVQKIAIEYGMSLKDASAFNVQFHKGRAVFIDTGSFERHAEGAPWGGYNQFCRHFLAPLALMAYKDPALGRMMASNLNGLTLGLCVKLLPWAAKFRMGLFLHLVLHKRVTEHYQDKAASENVKKKPYFSKNAMLGLIDQLQSTINGLPNYTKDKHWLKYYQENNYNDVSFAEKERFVERAIREIKPASVWDMGANTGNFSLIAERNGANVVAFDSDIEVLDKLYLNSKKTRRQILPLHMDIANPSANIGWAESEREGLLARGPADLVLALALIHHLVISNNIPLAYISQYFSRISKHLIIEMVPKDDSQIQRMLSSRKDVFLDYSQENFEAEFSKNFEILRKESLKDSKRILYFMKAKNGTGLA